MRAITIQICDLLDEYYGVAEKRDAQQALSRLKSLIRKSDYAMAYNRFYQASHKHRELRDWLTLSMMNDSYFTETPELVRLYRNVNGMGPLGYFLNQHLRERLLDSGKWAEVISQLGSLHSPLAQYGSRFILQQSSDYMLLLFLHRISKRNSLLRDRVTKKILGMRSDFDEEDWFNIYELSAPESYLEHIAEEELDELALAEDADLPEYPDQEDQ